jgi:NAD(P)H-dependent FMN reductase
MSNKKQDLVIMGTIVPVLQTNTGHYISLSGIAKHRDAERSDYIIQNWMRTRSTIDFIGLWEQLNNPTFNSIDFDGLKNSAGVNSFSLTPKKWIEATNAIGIISKAGKYGGTYAHKDIAFEFATWISAEFKLYLIKEFQRLKDSENEQLHLEWDLHRTLSKINYRIHTDAIKETLIPPAITKEQTTTIYANEADLLNVAVFGKTAKQWHEESTRQTSVNKAILDTLIEGAAGVIICTPEYVFSLPGILKNAIEWTVATTVFQDKPLAMIVASLSGEKAFESLDLIMTTVGAKMTPTSKLLITGAYSKLNKASNTLDETTITLLKDLMLSFQELA